MEIFQLVNNFQLVQQDILFTKYIISLKVPFEDTYIYIYFHREATSLLNRPPNLWIIDRNRSSLSPPHPTFFGSRTRHAPAPTRRRSPSPLLLLLLSPPYVCIRYDVPLFVAPPSSPPSPTRYIFPTSPTKLMYTVLPYSLPVMLSKGMNCSYVERNWCYLVAHASQFTTSKLIIFDLAEVAALYGRVTLKKGLFDSQKGKGEFVDTTSGINCDNSDNSNCYSLKCSRGD